MREWPRLQKLMRSLRSELLLRRQPHGLLGWRYLWPGEDSRIAGHAALWWNGPRSLPRLLWLMLEVWLWLRWAGFEAWRGSWRTVRRFGPEIRAREGLSLSLQGWRTLRLSMAWCIPPADVYLFGLYRNAQAALDYVYDQELAAYHVSRSRPLGLSANSLGLIQDKLALAERLAGVGVPMVTTLACLPRNQSAVLQPWLAAGGEVFCKTRRGNRGIGAFAAQATPDGWRGRGFDGRPLNGTAEVDDALIRLLKLDDALVQPKLRDHPLLIGLADGVEGDVITVRYISRWRDQRLECLSATLEIPARPDEKTGRPLYVILPIEPQTGLLLPCPEDLLFSTAARQRTSQVYEAMPRGLRVPDWQQLVTCTELAHAEFPDLWAIAWDWVITPDGPRLLEGNSGWGAAMPQRLYGGLMRGPR